MTRRVLIVALGIVLVAIAALAVRVRYQMGHFVTLGPSTPAQVSPIRGEKGTPLTGAEDFAIDRDTQRVYFSVFDRKTPRGHLYVMSLDDPSLTAHDITPADPKVFHPHGLDLFRDANGRVSLYVVNSPAIEIFDIAADGRASHRETIADPSFVALNAVAVVGPRDFYLTNDASARSPLRRWLTALLHTRESSVLHFDGAAATPVMTRLNHSSGIAASHDGNEIYVGEGYSWRLRVYRREAASGALTLTRTIPLHTAPDNLEVDPDGSVWVGAHPQPYKVYAYASDRSHPSPTQIVRVDLKKPDAEAASTVFADDGTRISAPGSGARIGKRLLISAIFDAPVVVTPPTTDAPEPPPLRSDFLSPEFHAAYARELARAAARPKLPAMDAPRAAWDKFDAVFDGTLQEFLTRVREAYPVEVIDTSLAGVHVGIVTPRKGVAAENRRRILIHLHGGGFVAARGLTLGQIESAPVAALGGFKVVTLDYRQAPFHRYPAASEDVAAVYRELLERYEPEAIGIFGCSAGGRLTAQALPWFAAHGLPRPGAVGVFCSAPVPFGKHGESETLQGVEASRPSTTKPSGYFAGVDPNDTAAFPGSSDATLAAFPPTLLVTGTRSAELSAAVVSHARFLKLGVDASLYIMEGGWHGAIGTAAATPEGYDANAYIARWFDRHLAR